MPHPNERTQRERMRTHLDIRGRMARACDAGVDVITVLLDDFVSALIRGGCRRNETEYWRRRAETAIDHQRDINGSADLVDLVMDMVPGATSEKGRAVRGRSGRTRTRVSRAQTAKQPRKRGVRFEVPHVQRGPDDIGATHSHTHSRMSADELAKQRQIIRSLQAILSAEMTHGADTNMTNTRRRLERQLVRAVVLRAQIAGTMTPSGASWLQQRFQKKGLQRREIEHGRIDVLGCLARWL